jgi:hypothetical protein
VQAEAAQRLAAAERKVCGVCVCVGAQGVHAMHTWLGAG